jgi:hypothetical protein
LRQAPAPLQVPSKPQVEALLAAHWVAGVGACPSGTGVQVPTLLVSAHDMQVPVQALLQQTPCAQKFDAHAEPEVQGAPGGSLPQLLLVQELGETQSAFVEQVVLQAVVPHWKGSHIAVVAARQLPAPSQVCACVSVEPVHDAAAPHSVPAG